MENMDYFVCQDWAQAMNVTESETVVYVTDVDYDMICQSLSTFDLSPPLTPTPVSAPAPQLDIVRKAAMLAGIPMGDDDTSNPDGDSVDKKQFLPSQGESQDLRTSMTMVTQTGEGYCHSNKRTYNDIDDDDDWVAAIIEHDLYGTDTGPDERGDIPLVEIPPIKRKCKTARPIRDQLLRRLTMKKNFKRNQNCCYWRCNDHWRWISRRQVYRDFD